MIMKKCGLLQYRKIAMYLLTRIFAVSIMTAKQGGIMAAESELVELQEIYRDVDSKSKKKLVKAAAQLLSVQKNLETKPKEDQSQDCSVKNGK